MLIFIGYLVWGQIETINPLEQGLKLCITRALLLHYFIETINPLEQGLKLYFAYSYNFMLYTIETINPLEQGLKPGTPTAPTPATSDIETINPLEQGLKLDISNYKRFTFID